MKFLEHYTFFCKWQNLATNLVVAITSTKKINIVIYFENLIVGLHGFMLLTYI